MKHEIKFIRKYPKDIWFYDGEGENIKRLKEYYLRLEYYNSIISDLPVRILVGSKRIGKSVFYSELQLQNKLS